MSQKDWELISLQWGDRREQGLYFQFNFCWQIVRCFDSFIVQTVISSYYQELYDDYSWLSTWLQLELPTTQMAGCTINKTSLTNKAFNWGLANSFRGLVHCHHGGNHSNAHDPGAVLRTTSSFTDKQKKLLFHFIMLFQLNSHTMWERCDTILKSYTSCKFWPY